MSARLKKIEDQVMVITGATSGIGLTTARLAASRGAKLVLVARNGDALRQLAEEIERAGGKAVAVVADVGVEDEVKAIGRVAMDHFGGFDTWVNNAGGSIYGPMTDVSTEDHRRLFDTNFWGVVYGSTEAAKHFRRRGNGYAGAIVNLGSVLSDRTIPIQGMYSTTKHAVKGFTEALRMELEVEGVPVSVSLVKPSSINTPFPQHARNYMDQEPTLPPPIYAPDVVARAILHCAETPERDVTVGFGGKAIALMGQYAPRLSDKYMEAFLPDAQKKGEAPRNPAGSLHAPGGPALQERGEYQGYVMESSSYTAAAVHPKLVALTALSAGVTIAALIGTMKYMDRPRSRSWFA